MPRDPCRREQALYAGLTGSPAKFVALETEDMSNAACSGPQSALSWDQQGAFALDWNGPIDRQFDAFPDEAKGRPLIELLEAMVRRYPERIALADSKTSMTYAEVWGAMAGWAERIAAMTGPGDLVGILMPVATAWPIAMLACLAAGRPFVALDPNSPPEWTAQVLGDARPSLLLVVNPSQGYSGPIPNDLRTLDLNDSVQHAANTWRPARMAPDEAACVLFTSGSTGQPKGVVNSQRNLLQRASQSINAAHINSNDRLLTLTSLCTIVGVRDLVTALLAGASVWLIDPHKAGVGEILRVIRDRRISILFVFPALLRVLLDGSPQLGAGAHLRLVRIGGDTTLWTDIALLRAATSPGTLIQLVYAATEAPMMQWFVGNIGPGDDARVPIGYPLPGNTLAIVDEDGAPTREGAVGELVVRSLYVALGSWSQGACNTKAIQTDACEGNMRIFRTGDLVRRRPDGLYERIGRKDRQVKIRGARVELDGVEVAIRRHESVRDVGVVVRADGNGDAVRLVAYVQPHETASGDFLDELEVLMRRTVPPPMRPWRFYLTPAIPRLPNSKFDGSALRAMDLAKSLEESDAQPDRSGEACIETDPLETLVARIWRDRLGLSLATTGDDFFSLGGDSLRALTMTFELETVLGRELPMNLINRAPTFAAFCAALRDKGPAVYSPLVVLKAGHGSPPLFFIHGMGGGVMELFSVGRKMTWPGAVIGIQARGVDGRDPPHDSVAAMTDEYLTAIKTRQPSGPYLLCGYSFGGLVAFELARRLREVGDEVAFVGLLATLPPGHHFLRVWTWAAYLYRRWARGLETPKKCGRARVGEFAASGTAALRAVASNALRASAAYRPGRYAGELTIFEPSSRNFGLPSSALLWSRHALKLRRHSLPGHHDEMLLDTNAKSAADLLTRCLETAVKLAHPSPPSRARP